MLYNNDTCILADENIRGPGLSVLSFENMKFERNGNPSSRSDIISYNTLLVRATTEVGPDQSLFVAYDLDCTCMHFAQLF